MWGKNGSQREVVSSSKMMDTKEEVAVANALKTPKIVFAPKKAMSDAAKSGELSIDKNGAARYGTRAERDGIKPAALRVF